MIFTWLELLYFIILAGATGFIFSDLIRESPKDVIERYTKGSRFSWKGIWYAILIAAPGVALHELAHKFVAIGFGLQAQFFIWPAGLAIGVIMKIIGLGFVILAPGYVSILGATSLQNAIISLAGPAMNGLIWLGCFLFLRYKKSITRKTAMMINLSARINKWLFIFNLIPIPPLDGSKILFYLIGLF